MNEEDLTGRVIDGRYELLERIGEGAMGAVYRARQEVVDREVAVKLLHGDVAMDSDYRARFEREAKALGKLDHPGCVRVHDFGWWDDLDAPFLVAEFIHGDPMHRRNKGLTPNRIARYGAAIAEAMEHAHARGIIHRDLKPENVIVRSHSDADTIELKVVDFGLARMPADEEVRLTQTGDAYGTPAYMSPEQCQADEEVGPRTDVYALGCMLWEMLHDRLPFEANKASAMLIKHVTSPVPPIERDVPPAFADLVQRMMAKSAADRPTMSEVSRTLRDLAFEDEPIELPDDDSEDETGDDDVSPMAETMSLGEDRRPGTTALQPTPPSTSRWLAAGAILILAIVGAALWSLGDDPATEPNDARTAVPSTEQPPSPTPSDDNRPEPPPTEVVAKKDTPDDRGPAPEASDDERQKKQDERPPVDEESPSKRKSDAEVDDEPDDEPDDTTAPSSSDEDRKRDSAPLRY